MRLIVISYPVNIKRETNVLIKLFEGGLDYYHLRKPSFSLQEMSLYIEDVPEIFHNRIILHDHYGLLNYFDIKGIHFTTQGKHLAGSYEGVSCQKSTSCHTIEELKDLDEKFSYTFLSPLFNSISKPGYKGCLPIKEVKEFLSAHHSPVKVIALGGIDGQKVEVCARAGFAGVAVLGYLWEPLHRGVDEIEVMLKFNLLKNKCKQFAHM